MAIEVKDVYYPTFCTNMKPLLYAWYKYKKPFI